MWEDITYDISYLKNISNDDKVFIKEMIETFVSNTPTYFETIDKSYEEKNFDSLYKSVHKYIPTLAFVSAQEYLNRFDKIEKLALSNQDSKELDALISDLRKYSMHLVGLLKKDYNL